MTKELYLKPNVVLEPLVDKWYAWSHLISPGTAAMNIVGRHHMITESYLAAPSIHAEAVLNPKMRGGPFMDFGGARIDEVFLYLDSYVWTVEIAAEGLAITLKLGAYAGEEDLYGGQLGSFYGGLVF